MCIRDRGYHVQIAQLLEEHGSQPDAAFERYGLAFAEQYGHADILKELQRLAESLHQWSELATYLRTGLESGDFVEPDLRIEMLTLTAQLYEEKVNHIEEAIYFYRLAVAEDPEHYEVLSQLARLYEQNA